MTIEERAAKAADLKAAGACNCSQAVVKVFEDKLSLDDETLVIPKKSLQSFSKNAEQRSVGS